MTAIREQLVDLIAETFGVPRERVTPESNWTDFEHDSLDLVELVIAIQEELEIDLDPKELKSLVTIGDLMNLVASKRGE